VAQVAAADPGTAAGRPPLVLTALPRCEVGAGEVVVCGRGTDRYRLPLPVERDAPDDPSAGAAAGTGAAARTPRGRCGIFAGERRCGEREAAAYGYGRGRDPITAAVRAARVLTGGEPEQGAVKP